MDFKSVIIDFEGSLGICELDVLAVLTHSQIYEKMGGSFSRKNLIQTSKEEITKKRESFLRNLIRKLASSHKIFEASKSMGVQDLIKISSQCALRLDRNK